MIRQNLASYIPTEKIRVIYNGLDFSDKSKSHQEILEVIAHKGKGIILGNAGRLTPQKGQQHLITLANNLKEENIEFTIFIAGTGELQSELEELIIQHDLRDQVILLGFVPEIPSFMNSIDIFLLTSLWEGFGYVLVEAMIASKPVVAFNTSSNPEIVLDNKTGFLIDYPDMKAFTQKTKSLIQDESMRQQMGSTGRDSALKRFQLSDRISELEQYLLEA
jgi:glycosyltransferase involved in cell wall biosynthesis